MPDTLDLRSLTRRELSSLVTDLGYEPYRGDQLFRWLWRPSVRCLEEMTNIPKGLRARLQAIGASVSGMDMMRVQVSRDGTVKMASSLFDRAVIETVIIPEQGHRTVCVSTQVGCAMGCRFCNTARMGFLRDLTPAEMVLQVLAAIEQFGGDRRAVRNIVFMGMGEPLMNYEHLSTALEILQDNMGLDFSKRRITVSTCGILPGIRRLGREHHVGLAVSLHSPFDQERSSLMPINRRYDLPSLISALEAYPLPKRRRITVEYLLLHGVNDSPGHAMALARLLSGLRVKVNLIVFNEIHGIPFKAPGARDVEMFGEVLVERGCTVTLRKSKGGDIDAACGQLCARISKEGLHGGPQHGDRAS